MLRPRARFRSFLWEHAPELAKDFNGPLIRFQIIGRHMCGGDLDRLLILGVIILRANEHPDYAALDPEEVMAGLIDPLPALPVNTSSIADSTGIPRESVRRKLSELVKMGWVSRERGAFRFTPVGYREVEPLRQAAIALTVQCTEAVERSLALHGMLGHSRRSDQAGELGR
jgi:hypothetical protein